MNEEIVIDKEVEKLLKTNPKNKLFLDNLKEWDFETLYACKKIAENAVKCIKVFEPDNRSRLRCWELSVEMYAAELRSRELMLP